ncbi:uncharacterized protein G2W53_015618 [Senna tora]|uniref:Uncharacterized protein n=1 Tax=Senna tora TaxID=362788 RepID=A0A834WV48_9FABA|nr:uncharacterized protein G2W53_015618 [Senna tora]
MHSNETSVEANASHTMRSVGFTKAMPRRAPLAP